VEVDKVAMEFTSARMTNDEYLLNQGEQRGIQKGIQKGIQQGRQQGIQEGRQQGAQETQERMIAKLMRRNKMSLEEAVRFVTEDDESDVSDFQSDGPKPASGKHVTKLNLT